jgi:hypothetical protein
MTGNKLTDGQFAVRVKSLSVLLVAFNAKLRENGSAVILLFGTQKHTFTFIQTLNILSKIR